MEVQKAKSNNNPLKIILIILAILLGLCMCFGGTLLMSGKSFTDTFSQEVKKIEEEANKIEASMTPTEKPSQTFYLGEQVKLKDNILKVNSISDYKNKNEYMQPKEGNKFVAVDVEVQNDGKEAFYITPFDFKIQDSKGYAYSNGLSDKEPLLGSDPVQGGRKVRGFVAFEVPATENSFELIYTPTLFGLNQIIIKLQNK